MRLKRLPVIHNLGDRHTNSSNTYRKLRALVAKTVANGCTPEGAVSAANLANSISEQQLNPSLIAWPAPPAGWGWDGEPGRGGKMVVQPEAQPAPKRGRKAKQAGRSAQDGRRAAGGDADAARGRRDHRIYHGRVRDSALQPHALVSVEARKKRGLDIRLDRTTDRYHVADE